jgi:DNA-binding SARP family transcriptional activator
MVSPFPTLRLRVLGGTALELPKRSVAGTSGRRRLIAMLALLSSAGERGIGRGRIAAAFWPDARDANARNDLKQLVFVARRTISADVFVPDVNTLIVNSAVLPSDVEAFHRAIRERRYEDAVALYNGPFLEDFHIADRPELAQLVERERERCAACYCEALETLAGRAGIRGEPDRAVHWWRLLVEADPLRDEYAMGLSGALADSGELTGALMHARRHVNHVRAELGEDVSAEFSRFVQSLPHRKALHHAMA